MLESEHVPWERRSLAPVLPAARPRKLAKVPFVELADGRLQGVVSSGSDVARVYVSSITAGSHALHCSTNNNRLCGGFSSLRPCKHLRTLVDEAVLQYGVQRVGRYLRIDVPEGAQTGADLLGGLTRGRPEPNPAAVVFSRFLRHLAYLELPAADGPLPELHWFPATGAGR